MLKVPCLITTPTERASSLSSTGSGVKSRQSGFG